MPAACQAVPDQQRLDRGEHRGVADSEAHERPQHDRLRSTMDIRFAVAQQSIRSYRILISPPPPTLGGGRGPASANSNTGEYSGEGKLPREQKYGLTVGQGPLTTSGGIDTFGRDSSRLPIRIPTEVGGRKIPAGSSHSTRILGNILN